MKTNIFKVMITVAIVLFISAQAFSQSKTIKLNTTGSRWKPSKIECNAGDDVTLIINGVKVQDITDDGYVHGFMIKDLGIEFLIKEGKNVFHFKAPDAGEYTFECSLHCGDSHDGMTGKLIVH